MISEPILNHYDIKWAEKYGITKKDIKWALKLIGEVITKTNYGEENILSAFLSLYHNN